VSERRRVLSWALYDFANSAFATTVMAGFFPLFFKQYWSAGGSLQESTYWLGLSNALAGAMLALSAPLLGTYADQQGRRKLLLGLFTLLGAVATGLLFWVPQGAYVWAAGFFVLGTIGFTAALTFYDALLVEVTSPKRFDQVSGLGYALGYLGGGLLFALNVVMYLNPAWFGLPDGAAAVQWSFLTVAVWWLLWSLPLFVFVPEAKAKEPRQGSARPWVHFQRTWRHFTELRKQPALLLFLLAYIFYIDGVNTIVKMAVDYGMNLGLKPQDLISALLLVQFIGFPAALVMGWLGAKMSPIKGIALCLAVYAVVTALAYDLETASQFYTLAALIGLVQGGIQALSRSHYARLVPQENAAEYFGFFNMMGKFSSILGPLAVAWVTWVTGEPRLGILILLAFFALGGFLLWRSARLSSIRP
jgi:MFS transporter, UMF1 family